MSDAWITIKDKTPTKAADPGMPPRGSLLVRVGGGKIVATYYADADGHVTSDLTPDAVAARVKVDATVTSAAIAVAAADVADGGKP